MTEELKLALVGLGRVAWLLERDPLEQHPCTHLGAWLKQPGVRLAAACDTDAEARARFSREWPDVPLYSDLADLLSAESPDVISLCAYATERAGMVVAAAEAGVRGIWAEKAVACSLAECDRVEAALDSTGARLIVSYLRRWDPLYQCLDGLMARQAIGELQTVTVHFSGNFLHTGTHAFDVLRRYCGEPLQLQAWLESGSGRVDQSGYRFSGESIEEDLGGDAVIRFDSGVTAFVHGRNKRYFRFEFELLGDRGMIRVGNSGIELWERAPSPHYSGFVELAKAAEPTIPAGNLWENAARHLVSVVREGATPICGIRDGRAALAMALALHESHRRGGQPVTLADVPEDLYVPSR